MGSTTTIWAAIRGGLFVIAVSVLLPMVLFEQLARAVGFLA